MRTVLDQVVIACADLEQGNAWLRAKLGVEPEEGGKHAAMGTHNRLLRLGPRRYLELSPWTRTRIRRLIHVGSRWTSAKFASGPRASPFR